MHNLCPLLESQRVNFWKMDKGLMYASLLKKLALFYVKYSAHSSAVSLLNHICNLAVDFTHRVSIQIP